MYEQYTDKQIVEMLVPKLNKAVLSVYWDDCVEYPEFNKKLIKAIATIYRSAYIRGEPKQSEHWVPATRDNIKVGSKVKMIDETDHRDIPDWFPDVGTIGTVTEVGFPTCLIQWPKGSTSGKDEWYCDVPRLEVLLCK